MIMKVLKFSSHQRMTQLNKSSKSFILIKRRMLLKVSMTLLVSISTDHSTSGQDFL